MIKIFLVAKLQGHGGGLSHRAVRTQGKPNNPGKLSRSSCWVTWPFREAWVVPLHLPTYPTFLHLPNMGKHLPQREGMCVCLLLMYPPWEGGRYPALDSQQRKSHSDTPQKGRKVGPSGNLFWVVQLLMLWKALAAS